MTNASNATEEFGERNQRRLAAGEALLSRLEPTKPPFDQNTLLELLNNLLLELENVVGDANLFSQVHPDAAVRKTAEDILHKAGQLRTRLMHSRRIYEALGTLEESSMDPLVWRAAML